VKHRCPRSWEVEAARDGRLVGDDRDRLVRHLVQCPSCARESRSLDAVSAALRSLPDFRANEVSLRRLKQRILGRVDGQLVRRGTSSPRFQGRAAAALALAATLLMFGVHRTAHSPELRDPTVDVVETPGASWTRRIDHEAERVDLRSGTLHFKVRRAPGAKRFVVRVPDGEIEDLGTMFAVTVALNRTRLVIVDEGQVTLRLVDGRRVDLISGQSWEPGASSTAAPPAADRMSPPIVASVAAVESAPPSEIPRRVAPAPRPQPPAVPSASVAAEEDVAYLNVLRLLRAGRTAEARAAARAYLRAFPKGFRGPEVAQVAEGGDAPR
jgi:hypothetical protein